MRTTDLTLPGRLLLWALRHRARRLRTGGGEPRFVAYTLEQLPAGARLRVAAEHLFATLVGGARRPLAAHCPECPALTTDEASIVLALHAELLDLGPEARWLLAEHQHRDSPAAGCLALRDLAATLRSAGLEVLPTNRGTKDLQSTNGCPRRGDAIADLAFRPRHKDP